MIAFVFAAVMTPTPDAITMLVVALPICGLYFVALGVCVLHDRRVDRRARRRGPAALDGTMADEPAAPERPRDPPRASSSTRRPARDAARRRAGGRTSCCRRAGTRSRTCRPRRSRRPPTARGPRPCRGSTPSSSSAATAWCTSASTSWPAPACRWASSPRAPATTSPARSRLPRGRRRGGGRRDRARRCWTVRGASTPCASGSPEHAAHEWYLGVLSCGFDAAINARANEMTWPKGSGRYVRALVAELARFRPYGYRVTMDDHGLGVGRHARRRRERPVDRRRAQDRARRRGRRRAARRRRRRARSASRAW